MGLDLSTINQPLIKGFNNYREYCVFWGDSYKLFPECKALNILSDEWRDMIEDERENPCTCPRDHSPEGLLSSVLVSWFVTLRLGTNLYGRTIEDVLKNSSHDIYTTVIQRMSDVEESLGAVPTVEDTKLFTAFLLEVCIQYDLDYMSIIAEAEGMYKERLQQLYKA